METPTRNCRRIILTGPESTGKTMLTVALATRYGAPYIAEYARDYIMGLQRPYTLEDVVHIARKQVEQMDQYSALNPEYLFVDTYLIITKVWFDLVFHKIPGWIDVEIARTKHDLYLLCRPDIPWEPDPVRENGGPMREVLFNRYENELSIAGLSYAYVEGDGEARVNCAIKQITDFYSIR